MKCLMKAKKVTLLLALGLGLSGCETVKVLDEGLSAHLEHALKRPPVLIVQPAQAGTAVKLRSGPGAEHPVIRVLAVGETVTPLGSVDDWRAVRVGSENGYVRSRDLRVREKGDQGLFAQP